MYAAKRPFRRSAIFLLILASYLLIACGGTTTNSNWPGLTTDGEKVYVAYGPGVIAYNVAEQKQDWFFPQEANRALQFFAAPSVEDGRVIFGDFGVPGGMLSPGIVVTLYALDNTGQGLPGTLWTNNELVTDRVVASPLQIGNQVFVGTANNLLLSLNATSGEKQWEFETGHSIWGQPAFKDGVLFVASMDKTIYALEAETGQEIWRTALGGALASSPVTNTDLVYVASFDGRLHALNMATGSEVWSAAAEDWIWDSPAFADGVVYYADIKGNIYAVDGETGNQIWTQQIGQAVQTSPVVVGNKVYIAAQGDINAETPLGTLTALDAATGEQKWQATAPASLYTTPVVVGSDIIVALQSESALLIGFDLETGTQQWVFAPAQ
ncbi:MAG: PQQ-binding-like beta-propeller repeat protein [Ardenticatenaceae bacterium]|nr:PQQ-binding-like beta-propeller repeat protein [Ardenticatenaceae bacterium]MCB9444746.1 PQQ-binding-like beta-propeller repeat protein [Ardenticatenaceae bacterium]